MNSLRNLVIVLGDQLDLAASAYDGFDPQVDAVWMAEASEESTHVWSSKIRTTLFLSAMRHFAQALRDQHHRVYYHQLSAKPTEAANSLSQLLLQTVNDTQPERLIMTAPGDWRVLRSIQACAKQAQVPLEIRDDRHFYCTVRDFAQHAKGRKSLRLEYFYREQRQKHGVLMDGDQPAGGEWNFDADNRQTFGKQGPDNLPSPPRFAPDALTLEVIELVEKRFASHPGCLDDFAWPVTRDQALTALHRFILERLPHFGTYQDAMWPDQPWLYHSLLSAAMNLKLLNPREVVEAAEAAYRNGTASLSNVEGFIRQILGWREYVRGIYWTRMPDYASSNALDAQESLPDWYWTADTDMACLHDAIRQTLQHGYAHHIQRLMVTGLYAQMLGVQPQQVHEWYLAVYVDAVEWVELPNTLGMSQYADNGLMASKPYIATGKYIERMSGYCRECRYQPGQRLGEKACPFTTLYWDFLIRHEPRLAKNPRLALQVKNLQRLEPEEKRAIQTRADIIRKGEIGACRSTQTT